MAGELILVVEDDARSLKLARDLLRAHGYRTLEAGRGLDGVALAREHAPAVVLMDVGLPDVSGVEALGELRRDPATRAIPVVAVTAQAMAGDRERLLAAGFDEYVAKPIEVRELPRLVRRLCEGTAGAGSRR